MSPWRRCLMPQFHTLSCGISSLGSASFATPSGRRPLCAFFLGGSGADSTRELSRASSDGSGTLGTLCAFLFLLFLTSGPSTSKGTIARAVGCTLGSAAGAAGAAASCCSRALAVDASMMADASSCCSGAEQRKLEARKLCKTMIMFCVCFALNCNVVL